MTSIAIIYIDERERGSKVPEILMAKGMTVIFKVLDVGDYVINNVIGIERKTANDYINSLIDGRLFEQLNKLKERYDKAILIIEGSIHKVIRGRGVHRNAILGSYTSLVLDLGVFIIHTQDEEETAELIKRMALYRTKTTSAMVVRRKPKHGDISEWQKFVLQCFPHIGPKIAQRILERFGSIYDFCKATVQELSLIEGLNERKAGEIYQILHTIHRDYVKYRQSKSSEQQKKILDYISLDKDEKTSLIS